MELASSNLCILTGATNNKISYYVFIHVIVTKIPRSFLTKGGGMTFLGSRFTQPKQPSSLNTVYAERLWHA